MDKRLAIEYRPIGSLLAYANNSRTHSPAQVEQIVASMREFGWTNPILVDGANGVIAGHGRLLAAQRLNLASVPVIELAHLTDAQKRAYVIADNKLAEQAGWDEAVLAAELRDLAALDFDLGLTGFGADELADLLGDTAPTGGHTDPDAVPAVPVAPVSKPGDVWRLGRHRLACGDSTSDGDVDRLLSGASPHLMVTDPPYGVEYDPAWRAEVGVNQNTGKMGKVLNDDRADWREAWALFPGHVVYCWHAGRHASGVQASLESCGFEIRCQIVWAKERFALSRGHYHWQHEPCWYAVRKGATAQWAGDRSQTTLWTINTREGGGAWPRHAEAGRVHAPADSQQLQTGRRSLRTVQRIRHHAHRCRGNRACLLRDGIVAELRRRGDPPLARLHRPAGHPRRHRQNLRGACA